MADKAKVIFLGTGAMIPDGKRNHPSFLVVYKDENVLIDCGEGTQIQFRKKGLNPCKITKILITHWHGDHTFGLPGLLRTLATSGYKKKLMIYGPRGLKRHFEEMFVAFGEINEFPIEIKEVSGKFLETPEFYIEAESMIHVQPCNAYNFVIKDKSRVDKKKLKKYKIKPGKHIGELKAGKDILYEGKKYRANDLIFKEPGKKISFVLDTRLNDKIIPFVKGADVLVCESSFDSSLGELAYEYQHLTSKQVAEIGKKAKVGKLYLVHLSQRYSKNSEVIVKEVKKIFKNSSAPNDLEEISV